MAIARFLEHRKSVRDFKDKKVNKSTAEKIENAIAEVIKESGRDDLFYNFYEDGKTMYDNLEDIGGYNGVMIKAPQYIGLEVMNENPDTLLYGAYNMEKLITKLSELDLDCCWITVGHVDNSLMQKHGGKVNYLLAVGQPKRRLPFFTEPESESERLSLQDIVYKDEVENPIEPEELDSLGLTDTFYYLRYAPSSYNNQPWRFLIKDNKVHLLYYNSGEGEIRYADVGVMMYYFEELAKSKGIGSDWELTSGELKGENASYIKIAAFSI